MPSHPILAQGPASSTTSAIPELRMASPEPKEHLDSMYHLPLRHPTQGESHVQDIKQYWRIIAAGLVVGLGLIVLRRHPS